MLGATLIFLMGVCVGFLISDNIKENWPRPKLKKSKSAELSPLIKSAVEAIRHAEEEKAKPNQVMTNFQQVAAISQLPVKSQVAAI
jgi:hypothetical protein